MSDIDNLTGRIDHLRDRKNKPKVDQKNHFGKASRPSKLKITSERRFATDYFMLVAYSLLGAAILSQFFLIIWLDII